MDVPGIAPLKTAGRAGFAACLVAIGMCATASGQDSLLNAVQSRLSEHPHETHLHYYMATLNARQHRWPEVNQALDALLRAEWPAGVDPTQFSGYETQRAVAGKIAALQRRTQRGFGSRLTFSLAERELIPEGIAYDAQTDSFLIGSIHKSKVIRVTREGVAADLVAQRTAGLDEVLGLKADSQRRVLWVASVSGSTGVTSVVRFHLDTGALIGRHELRAEGKQFGFNDLCLHGDLAYVTEMVGGAIYEIRPEQRVPRAVTESGRLRYPNGIACQGDTVWVSDVFALHAFDVRSAQLHELENSGAISGAGIDGLAVACDRLIGIQNGFGRGRIVELRTDARNRRIVSGRVLEGVHPAFDVPTTGVVVDDAFHYIANSQLAQRSADGTLASPGKLRDVLILNLPLSRRASSSANDCATPD